MSEILFTIKIYDETVSEELEEMLKVFLESDKVFVKKENYYLSGGILNEEYFNILLSKLFELKENKKLQKCIILPAKTDDIPVSTEKLQVIEL